VLLQWSSLINMSEAYIKLENNLDKKKVKQTGLPEQMGSGSRNLNTSPQFLLVVTGLIISIFLT
jgi:hypothetical protein